MPTERVVRPEVAAARLVRALKPGARLYAEYLENADLYDHAFKDRKPQFRLLHGQKITARLSFRQSILFERDYLVAWVEDDWAIARARPTLDAFTSSIPVPWSSRPLPIILAPERRRRSRGETFLSILEHEIVHVNQAIRGFSIPEFSAASVPALIECFYAYAHREHEAHFIQSAHWPPRLTFGSVKLSFEQWVLLRAYTPAIEEILRGVVAQRIPERILPKFLDEVPKAAVCLREMGCRSMLVSWFQTRWSRDVASAMNVLRDQGVDLRCAPLRGVYAWLYARPELRTVLKWP